MALRFLFLVLPALSLAHIDVDVSGKFGDSQSDINIYYSGNQISIITDQERNSFSLSDNNVKNGVNAYFGARPTDAYLRTPTPWGDLFKSNNWDQVSRILRPISGRVVAINAKPLIVMQQQFDNNSTKSATFNVGISSTVENTVSSVWSKNEELSVEQIFDYGFEIEMFKLGSATKFNYTSRWGQDVTKSQMVTIGSSSGMEVLLEPGQSVVTELHSTRGTIKVEMEYEASLTGSVAVNYESTYKGHHFWALDINAVMQHGNLKDRVRSKETIEFEFYAYSSVVVRDNHNGIQLMNVAF